jgi:hypothetical protein
MSVNNVRSATAGSVHYRELACVTVSYRTLPCVTTLYQFFSDFTVPVKSILILFSSLLHSTVLPYVFIVYRPVMFGALVSCRWKQNVPAKHFHLTDDLHGVMGQKPGMNIRRVFRVLCEAASYLLRTGELYRIVIWSDECRRSLPVVIWSDEWRWSLPVVIWSDLNPKNLRSVRDSNVNWLQECKSHEDLFILVPCFMKCVEIDQ